MPPTRRKSSQQAQAQQTLSFGARSNKITKPSLPASKSLTKPSPLAKAAVDEISTPSHTTDEEGENTLLHVKEEPPLSPGGKLAIREQKKIEKPARSEIEVKAEKLSEDELRKYWRAEEQSRKARRVHQEGLRVNEKILRHFDLSSQYGPCIGITRIKRWKRANALGLKPPVEVLAVLMKEEATLNPKAQTAYIDELLNTKIAGD